MITLVDGRSGAGKTEFARALAAETGAELVSLDDVYPGWDGLDAGSADVARIIRDRTWRRWDWARGVPGEWHRLGDGDLVIEGVGAISRDSRPLADRAIWIELDAPSRKARALARDGALYAPHWDDWAAQEETFIARENPTALATEIRRVEP